MAENNRKNVTLSLTQEEHDKLRQMADADQRTISAEVNYLVDRRRREVSGRKGYEAIK